MKKIEAIFAAWIALAVGCTGGGDDRPDDEEPTGTPPWLIPHQIVIGPVDRDQPDSAPQPVSVIGTRFSAMSDEDKPLYPGQVEILYPGGVATADTFPDGGFGALLWIDASQGDDAITLKAMDLVAGLDGEETPLSIPEITQHTPPAPIAYDPATNSGVFVQPHPNDRLRVSVEGRRAVSPVSNVMVSNIETGEARAVIADEKGNFALELQAEERDEIVVMQQKEGVASPPLALSAPPRGCEDDSMKIFFGRCEPIGDGKPLAVVVPGTQPKPIDHDEANGAFFVSSIHQLTAEEGQTFVEPFRLEAELRQSLLGLVSINEALSFYYSPPEDDQGIWLKRSGGELNFSGNAFVGEAGVVGFYRVGVEASSLCRESIRAELETVCFDQGNFGACDWLKAALIGCGWAACGDGFVNRAGEDCDDRNRRGGDGCDADCLIEGCGDGVTQAILGEECDDGNRSSTDSCTNRCKTAACGDGFVRFGEEACDDGAENGQPGRCDVDCGGLLQPLCGNKLVELGEVCDDGNLIAGDGCSANCEWEACGNGVLDQGEGCDDANLTSGDGCSDACVSEGCGDGMVADVEECDDANDEVGDGCDENCLIERCGNGILQHGETCDDGNGFNEDGCSNLCHFNLCGDGIRYPGIEICDGETLENCDVSGTTYVGIRNCLADCSGWTACISNEYCGDGVVNGPENCDSGKDNGSFGNCDPTCSHIIDYQCGDGSREAEEECDDGGLADGDGCSSDCRLETVAVPSGTYAVGSDALADFYGFDQPTFAAFPQRDRVTGGFRVEILPSPAKSHAQAESACDARGRRLADEEEWQILYETVGAQLRFAGAEWTDTRWDGLETYFVVKKFSNVYPPVDEAAFRDLWTGEGPFGFRCVE